MAFVGARLARENAKPNAAIHPNPTQRRIANRACYAGDRSLAGSAAATRNHTAFVGARLAREGAKPNAAIHRQTSTNGILRTAPAAQAIAASRARQRLQVNHMTFAADIHTSTGRLLMGRINAGS
jgi:hypothetical protein